jgi:hypothetical protein
MGRFVAWAMMGGFALASIEGCTLTTGDASQFKEPIPQQTDVALGLPHAGSATSGQAEAMVRIQTNGPTGTGSTGYSGAYEFTRNMTDMVDLGTGLVLGLVWVIVNLPPTHIDANTAVWGPGQGDALDPIVWRFTATDVGDHEYTYELDGRPKASTSEADYQAVLTGHGYGKDRPEHRTGWFQVQQDAFNALDTARAHDSGSVKVTFDLRAMPYSIAVELKTNDGSGQLADIDVTHDADGGGTVGIKGSLNLDLSPNGQLETVNGLSRYNGQGAGRSDLQVSGGDVPANLSSVTASECWSSSFLTTYYTDSANWRATTGDPSTCAFPATQF